MKANQASAAKLTGVVCCTGKLHGTRIVLRMHSTTGQSKMLTIQSENGGKKKKRTTVQFVFPISPENASL